MNLTAILGSTGDLSHQEPSSSMLADGMALIERRGKTCALILIHPEAWVRASPNMLDVLIPPEFEQPGVVGTVWGTVVKLDPDIQLTELWFVSSDEELTERILFKLPNQGLVADSPETTRDTQTRPVEPESGRLDAMVEPLWTVAQTREIEDLKRRLEILEKRITAW